MACIFSSAIFTSEGSGVGGCSPHFWVIGSNTQVGEGSDGSFKGQRLRMCRSCVAVAVRSPCVASVVSCEMPTSSRSFVMSMAIDRRTCGSSTLLMLLQTRRNSVTLFPNYRKERVNERVGDICRKGLERTYLCTDSLDKFGC